MEVASGIATSNRKIHHAALGFGALLIRSYSARRAWCISHRSTSCCKPSHISGDVPKARASLCAMSVVTGLRSCSISLTVRRETPSKRASLSCVNPAVGKTSSRRTSPGCVGRLFLLFSQLFGIVQGQRRRRLPSNVKVMRQLPLTVTLQVPARLPFSWCKR